MKPKKTKVYYEFIEHNEWEGESWSFYVPLDYRKFKNIQEAIEGNESYEIKTQPYFENEVDKLIKQDFSQTNYMSSRNKCSGIFKLPKKIDWDNDPFYKGGLWKIEDRN